jgi:hypothetical protein
LVGGDIVFETETIPLIGIPRPARSQANYLIALATT